MPVLTTATALTTASARLAVLELELPGGVSVPAGVLLEDPGRDRLWVRLRRDWGQIAPEESEVLEALERDLNDRAAAMGAARLLEHLEDTLSNVLRIGPRREVMVEDFGRALARLYREHVSSTVREFVTHVRLRRELRLTRGHVRSAHRGPVDGTADSGWRAVSCSAPEGDRVEAGKTGAGGGARPRLQRSLYG